MTDRSHADELLTVDEVADVLKVNHRTVRSYIASGALVASRLGDKLLRIRRSDLDEFVRRSQVEAS